jgi:amidophosphoribosyltransferase
MSDYIKHECGLAVIRLLQPLDYYQHKYGTSLYGLNRLQLLLQKMRNRGQDGAGLATIKLDVEPGKKYISRKRSIAANYLDDLFAQINRHFTDLRPEELNDPTWMKANKPYTGELLIGHLRYGTHGKNDIETCHPFLRQSNWKNRNLIVAGNFNLTNVDEMFNELVALGQYPKEKSDTVTVLEKIGHFLDDEVQRLHTWFKPDGYSNEEINDLIVENLEIARMLRRAARKFDGGFVMGGLIGHGDAFVLRDPAGIRPAFYYKDDEIAVVASERPAIQTTFNVHFNDIRELQRGHALVIRKNGEVTEEPVLDQLPRAACSFERIYFSRGNDRDIYLERKELGRRLAKPVLKAVDYDYKKTVFSYIPNTAETAWYGMMEGLNQELNQIKEDKIRELGKNDKGDKLRKILDLQVRTEKLVLKDAKQRTFIADTAARGELVAHVYDVTYGLVRDHKDTLVLLDDSIVRGTTLKSSIVQILSRLRPKKIVIVSSAPQIRYPDCYGIDMSRLGEFVAFRALVELLREEGKEKLLHRAYQAAKAQEKKPMDQLVNVVQGLYDRYTDQQLSNKIAQIVTPDNLDIELEIIYQTIDDLRESCPNNNGDWYFSGNYPTPGGNRVVNRAFMNYMEGSDERGY